MKATQRKPVVAMNQDCPGVMSQFALEVSHMRDPEAL